MDRFEIQEQEAVLSVIASGELSRNNDDQNLLTCCRRCHVKIEQITSKMQ